MGVFDTVLVRKPKKSRFNLNHSVLLTCNAGYEVPFMCQEAIPGDVFKISSEVLVKAAPLIAPLMHQVNLKVEFWYVPNRLVFPKWENYINPKDENDEALKLPQVYRLPIDAVKPGTLWDYLGLPTPFANGMEINISENRSYGINALPFLAYQMIWNEFYRDPNMQSPIKLPADINPFYDGNIKTVYEDNDEYLELFNLRKRCWEKDYFTTAQPDVQRGDDVMLNMSGNATFNVENFPQPSGPNTYHIQNAQGGTDIPIGQTGLGPNGRIVPYVDGAGKTVGWQVQDSNGNNVGGVQSYQQALSQVQQLSGNIDMDSGISINDLRELNVLQKYKERLQLAGTRYIDWLKAFFGVYSSDARLQRPQFLGGGRVPLTIGETLQTSQTTDTSPQGTRTGNFYALSSTPSAKYKVEENGYIIGVLCVIPRTSYYQGIPRHFTKFDRYDFAIPMFANLGEQPVRRTELFIRDGVELNGLLDFNRKGGLFGYQQRYAEYKSIPSSIHGLFRTSLDSWHWARKFENTPVLGKDFLACDPDYRPFAIEDENLDEHFYIELYNHVTAVRPLPKIAMPQL